MVRNLPVTQDTWVQFLGGEDPLEKGMATNSSILAWRIPWTEEPGGSDFHFSGTCWAYALRWAAGKLQQSLTEGLALSWFTENWWLHTRHSLCGHVHLLPRGLILSGQVTLGNALLRAQVPHLFKQGLLTSAPGLSPGCDEITYGKECWGAGR